jgi:hypothetical protein
MVITLYPLPISPRFAGGGVIRSLPCRMLLYFVRRGRVGVGVECCRSDINTTLRARPNRERLALSFANPA